MIKIDATQMSEGIDYGSFLADYYAGMPVGSSTYRGGTPSAAFGGLYYVSGPEVSFDYEGFDQMTLLEGEDIAYDFITYGAAYGHGISGSIDEVVFGLATDETTTDDGTANGEIVGLDELLRVSGLDVTAEPGSGNGEDNAVYTLYSAVRYGANGEDVDYIDTLYAMFSSEAQHFLGTNQNDTYTGTEFDDVVKGFNGDDVLEGAGGDDKIYGARGSDILTGGEGDDLVSGDAGDDYLEGNAGNDSLYGQAGDDVARGGKGDDLVAGFQGDDILYGDAGNDTVMGGGGEDVVNGGKGDDALFGRHGDDVLFGNVGHDRLYGDAGNDTLYGGAGRDGLFGGQGADVFAFERWTASTVDAADNIRDFETGIDIIDLSEVGDLGFVDDFTGAAGEIVMVERSDRTNVQVDMNGDGEADMLIVVHATGLTESDFFL